MSLLQAVVPVAKKLMGMSWEGVILPQSREGNATGRKSVGIFQTPPLNPFHDMNKKIQCCSDSGASLSM